MNFFRRLTLAFSAFFSILSSAKNAERFLPPPKKTSPHLPHNEKSISASLVPSAQEKIFESNTDAKTVDDHRDALHLLAIFQREGRLVDFLQEDMGRYSDEEIGAAARSVHDGCRKALDTYVPLVPVIDLAEGSGVTVDPKEANRSVNLTGNLSGQGPFKGILCHRGWKAASVNLPTVSPSKDLSVVAPAEVEI